MEAIITSLGSELYVKNNHKGYLIHWDLISPLCKKWSRNRDSDAGRVNDMLEFHKSGGYLPRIIHLAEVVDGGFVCYDGNHRREVFTLCKEPKFLCIIDVMFNVEQKDVYQAFENINKSIQVPAIYLEETTIQPVKEQILQLVKSYETRFRRCVSSSPRYHAPNFNRDILTDNIYQIYTSFNRLVSIEDIGKSLEVLNGEYAKGNLCRDHTKYTQGVVDKCKKYGLWLFLERAIPFEHVERVMIMKDV